MVAANLGRERTVSSYCYQCVAGPDLLKVRVEDDVATEVLPNFEAAGIPPVAQEIGRFPQVCVRADRRSAIKSHGLSVREALIQEWYNGRKALIEDGVAGASRFKDGLGRHGDFQKIR